MGRVGFLILAATVLLAGCGIPLDGRLTSVIEGVASYRGSFDTGGNTRSVALSSDHAYVFDSMNFDGSGDVLVQIIDVSDLTNPLPVADLETTGQGEPRLKTFQHSNGTTYLMMLTMYGGPEVLLYDLSDPDAPAFVSEFDLFEPYGAADARIVDDVAYIVGSGFAIIDLSDPATPIIRGELSASTVSGGELCLLGDYAYIANGSGGLIIVDVSLPDAPEVVLTDTQFGSVGDVELSENGQLVVCDGLSYSYLVNPTNAPNLDPGPRADILGQFSEPSPQGASAVHAAVTAPLVCHYTYGVQVLPAMDILVQTGVLAAPGADRDEPPSMNNVVWGDNGTLFYAVAYGSEGLVLFEAVPVN